MKSLQLRFFWESYKKQLLAKKKKKEKRKKEEEEERKGGREEGREKKKEEKNKKKNTSGTWWQAMFRKETTLGVCSWKTKMMNCVFQKLFAYKDAFFLLSWEGPA